MLFHKKKGGNKGREQRLRLAIDEVGNDDDEEDADVEDGVYSLSLSRSHMHSLPGLFSPQCERPESRGIGHDAGATKRAREEKPTGETSVKGKGRPVRRYNERNKKRGRSQGKHNLTAAPPAQDSSTSPPPPRLPHLEGPLAPQSQTRASSPAPLRPSFGRRPIARTASSSATVATTHCPKALPPLASAV